MEGFHSIITIIFTHQIPNSGPNQRCKTLSKHAKMASQVTGGAIRAYSPPPYADLTLNPSVLNLITDTEVTDILRTLERENTILVTNGILRIYELI